MGVSPPTVLELLPKKDSGKAPYTGAFSEHGSGHTAVTRAQWVKRMHRMPTGNRVDDSILPTGDQVVKLEEDLIAG